LCFDKNNDGTEQAVMESKNIYTSNDICKDSNKTVHIDTPPLSKQQKTEESSIVSNPIINTSSESVSKVKKKNIIYQVFWLLKNRPEKFFELTRGFILFRGSYLTRTIFPFKRVTLGTNVRLQKNASLMAENPSARISVGSNSIIYEDCKIEAYHEASINIARDCVFGGAKIVSRYGISFGERCLISWNTFIQDFDPHPVSLELRKIQVESLVSGFKPMFDASSLQTVSPEDRIKLQSSWNFPGEQISIGNDVWIGADVTILKGAKIGDGCIIATRSLVLKGEYPPNSLIAGNPATVLKQL
jgi:acetyltransferase-like isoleucine patch superfamily enzyme